MSVPTGAPDWNATAYHRISNPHMTWGRPVLARLPLAGTERVLDVGSGTGRLTSELADRLPHGCVVAVDRSAPMLSVARESLRRQGGRCAFVRADAAALPFREAVDAIFSTASFHWVLDHPALFRSLHAALKPGGRLVAQCGGGPNLDRLHARALALMQEDPFAPYYAGWRDPWLFADDVTTAARLREAGFTDVVTSLESAPVVLENAAAFTEYVAEVICRHHLACLPTADLRAAFLARLAALAAGDDPPFELDYWRLNMEARRPHQDASMDTARPEG